MEQVWCEIDTEALEANARVFRKLIGVDALLAVAVKANAYGHGSVIAARAFLAGGADWLCVHSLSEAIELRAAGIVAPIYLVGPVALDDLEQAASLNLKLVVYNAQTVERLKSIGTPARLHIKIETGNHRQGIGIPEALALADSIRSAPHLELEGACSHFANIEDTTDHRYARSQLAIFDEAVTQLRSAGHVVPIRHLSNSAACILWPEQDLDMVRVGIGAYGLWPSKETHVAAALVRRGDLAISPALTWKTRIAQVKEVPEGALVGYGCTWEATRPSRLAILPMGYFDGYDRRVSNLGHVLCRGRRAPVRGRVCMNITMIDVTDIPDVALEDEVVLMGGQGEAVIPAEMLADWSGTINYEVLARLGGHMPRIARPGSAHTLQSEGFYRPPRS